LAGAMLGFVLILIWRRDVPLPEIYPNQGYQPGETEVVFNFTEVVQFYIYSIETLANISSHIVLGEAIEIQEVINFSGFDDILYLGQVHEFYVEEYFKGSGEEKIKVIVNEGTLSRPGVGLNFTEADVQEVRDIFEVPQIVAGRKYILFLMQNTGNIAPESYFFNGWRFDVTDPHDAVFEGSPVNDFPFPREMNELLARIRSPELFVTPSPGITPHGYPEPVQPFSPYPEP
jgi:hypothetical protein